MKKNKKKDNTVSIPQSSPSSAHVPVARSPFSTLARPPDRPKETKPADSLNSSPSNHAIEQAANKVDMQRLSLHSAIFQSILDVKGCFYMFKRVESIVSYLQRVYVVPETSLLYYSRLSEPDEPSETDSASSLKNGSHVLV